MAETKKARGKRTAKQVKAMEEQEPPRDIQVERVTREVTIPLTEADLTERREKAADLQERLDTRRSSLESLTAKFKEGKAELEKEINETEETIAVTLREIKSKKAKGVHQVDEVRNYEKGMVEYFYPDQKTGQLVDERVFTAEEHQRKLFTEEAEAIPSTGQDPLESELMQ